MAERFVRTVRSEFLDWMLVLNQQHLERILDVFVTLKGAEIQISVHSASPRE